MGQWCTWKHSLDGRICYKYEAPSSSWYALSIYLDVESLIPNNKQLSHPILQVPATSSRTQPEKKADSLTKPKWKIKMSKNSHIPKENKSPLLGARNPLIASTPLLTSICSHLSPITGLLAAAEKKGKAFRVFGWLEQAEANNKDGRSTSKAKEQSKVDNRFDICYAKLSKQPLLVWDRMKW